MVPSMLRKLLLLATLIAVVAGQRCRVPVPFTTRLVGKRFTKFDDCYRPSTKSEIGVNAKTFVLTPFIITTFKAPVCDERYVFHFRRDGKDPFVVYFPALEFPGGSSGNLSDAKLKRFCDKNHSSVREKYFPTGKTRKRFKESVRTIIKETTVIRDFGCTETDEGLIIQVPGRAFTNVDLDGIITYLLGVAYQYNFCAESA